MTNQSHYFNCGVDIIVIVHINVYRPNEAYPGRVYLHFWSSQLYWLVHVIFTHNGIIKSCCNNLVLKLIWQSLILFVWKLLHYSVSWLSISLFNLLLYSHFTGYKTCFVTRLSFLKTPGLLSVRWNTLDVSSVCSLGQLLFSWINKNTLLKYCNVVYCSEIMS